jgi:hypothetical protein
MSAAEKQFFPARSEKNNTLFETSRELDVPNA